MRKKPLFAIILIAMPNAACSFLRDWICGGRTGSSGSLVARGQVVRKSKDASLAAAMAQMTARTGTVPDRYKARVRTDPPVAALNRQTGSGGGGTLD